LKRKLSGLKSVTEEKFTQLAGLRIGLVYINLLLSVASLSFFLKIIVVTITITTVIVVFIVMVFDVQTTSSSKACLIPSLGKT